MELVRISRSRVEELEKQIKKSYAIYGVEDFKLNEDCQFENKEFIAEGSFSKVYKSRLEDEPTEVALKVLQPNHNRQEKSNLLMYREMLLSSKMNHNNVVKLIKICIHGGRKRLFID